MSEETAEARLRSFEERSRALFNESVLGLDMPTRSRLTQARHAALAAAARSSRRPWLRAPVWASATGVTAAAALGIALWFGFGQHTATLPVDSKFEDMDIIASSDESSADAMDMLQDDIDFYAWADKSAGAVPATAPATGASAGPTA